MKYLYLRKREPEDELKNLTARPEKNEFQLKENDGDSQELEMAKGGGREQ